MQVFSAKITQKTPIFGKKTHFFAKKRAKKFVISQKNSTFVQNFK